MIARFGYTVLVCFLLLRQLVCAENTVFSEGFCEDKPLYNAHDECDKYIVCQGFAVAVILQCPYPLVWDNIRKICNWREYSTCTTESTTRAPAITKINPEIQIASLQCEESKCQLPNCCCQGDKIPGKSLKVHHIPQMVLISFEDGISSANFQLYQELFDGKKNPNNCPLKATFFVSGKGNDFDLTKKLYEKGHEIGVQSTSHYASKSYWKNISYHELAHDAIGLKIKLASKGIRRVVGYRSPFLQTSGDTTYSVLTDYGFRYDSSIPTRMLNKPWWPYTMEYGIKEYDCLFPPCYQYSYPGFWQVPPSPFKDNQSCTTYESCFNHPQTTAGVYDFLVSNFNRHYNDNKAPFTLFGHASWMLTERYMYRKTAFLQFINYINSLPDVYVVSLTQALDWMQNTTDLTQLLRQQLSSWSC